MSSKALDHRPSVKAASPHRRWKEKLMELCLQRVRHQRSRSLWKARSSPQENVDSALHSIMADELHRLRTQQDMIWQNEPLPLPSQLSSEEYEELMLAMQKVFYEKQDEMRDQEHAELLEQRSLNDFSEHQENAVLCPICKRAYLYEAADCISCNKGCFRLDVRTKEHFMPIGLEFLRTRLAELLTLHFNTNCRDQPVFSFQDTFGIKSLIIHCNSCDFFDAVI